MADPSQADAEYFNTLTIDGTKKVVARPNKPMTDLDKQMAEIRRLTRNPNPFHSIYFAD